jgi:flagellin
MVVQHNITAMNSNRMLGITTAQQSKSSEKLSSGYKINRAADDAAGLSISEKMRRQIRGLTQASSNAQDGISMVQTAEGALSEVHDMLQRMNELAVKSANGSLTSTDRSYIQSEVNALTSEIDRVSDTTTFNDQFLLKGTTGTNGTGANLEKNGINLQVGSESGNVINLKISSMSFSAITRDVSTAGKTVLLKDGSNNTVGLAVSGSDGAAATSAITVIKTALANVSTMRSNLGAVQNRLEHTIKNLDNVVENTTSAESSIRDTDMATEMVKYSNNNILSQAGQSMLAQANKNNQGVLSLLQ